MAFSGGHAVPYSMMVAAEDEKKCQKGRKEESDGGTTGEEGPGG